MKYIKKFVFRGLFGIPIGIFINQLIYFIMALKGNTVAIAPDTIISQFLISSLVGFYSTGISVIFDVEEWSLLRQTITHSIAMLCYFPIAIYAGWMPEGLFDRLLFVLFYILIYVIIWFSFLEYWKRKSKELNEELKKYNQNKK